MNGMTEFVIKGNVLVKYNGHDKQVVVPEGIVEIGAEAFKDCLTTESVILPDTLEAIGSMAFFASGVKSVKIPNGVETIGRMAFCCCRSLLTVALGASVKCVGAGAFESASKLYKVEFNKGLLSVEKRAFADCKSLTSAVIPAGIKELSDGVFSGCGNLQSVVLSEGLEEIGEHAFYGARLRNFVIPSSVIFVGDGAFAGSDVASFKTESGSPFCVTDGCLIDVSAKRLVAGCPSSVIPEDGSVIGIASNAFACYDFKGKAITIPLAVIIIEDNAFFECENYSLRCKVDEYDEPVGWDEHFYEHPDPWDEGYECFVPQIEWGCMSVDERAEKDKAIREKAEAEERFRLSQLNDYVRENGVMTAYVGQGGEIVIPEDVRIIRAKCFDNCDNVKVVKLHFFVEYVEAGAFEKFKDAEFYFQAEICPKGFRTYKFKRDKLHFGCITDVERVKVNNELVRRKQAELALRGFAVEGEFIRKYRGTDKNVVLPYNDATYVDKGAFKDNDVIVSVNFGSLDEIWACAFQNCASLEEVILPETVTRFSDAVFCDCPKLNIKRFPALTREIGQSAFSGSGQEEINLNLDFVGAYGFYGCQKLKRVVITNDGRCTLRWKAFSDCRALESVELNFESVEMEWGMFEGCSSLKSVKLPDGLQKIGASAFKDCALTSITLPETLTEVGAQAFLNCGNMGELYIPRSVSKMGDGAFIGCTFTKITLPERFKNDIARIFGRRESDPFGFDEPNPEIVFLSD